MTVIKMSLAISKFKSIFSYQICPKSCKIHDYKFAFHGEHSVWWWWWIAVRIIDRVNLRLTLSIILGNFLIPDWRSLLFIPILINVHVSRVSDSHSNRVQHTLSFLFFSRSWRFVDGWKETLTSIWF